MVEGLNGWEALDGCGVHRPATALRAWPRQQTLDRQLLLVCICAVNRIRASGGARAGCRLRLPDREQVWGDSFQ